MFKWQVEFNTDISIPFARTVCDVAVRAVSLKIMSEQPVKIVHVISNPISESCKFWINNHPSGYCLRSVVNVWGGQDLIQTRLLVDPAIEKVEIIERDLTQTFPQSDTEFHTLDLMENWSLKLHCVNEKGAPIECSGYCMLDVHINE